MTLFAYSLFFLSMLNAQGGRGGGEHLLKQLLSKPIIVF